LKDRRSGWFVCLFVLPGVLLAQLWVARYDGPAGANDQAAGIVRDPAGYVYVTGFTAGSTSGHDFLTIKYNPAGETVWTRRYSGAGAADDEAVAVAYDPRGYVVVTGFTTNTSIDFLTIKYNSASGETLWARRVNGPAGGVDKATDIAIDDAGNVYASGYVRVGGHHEAAVVKYNQAGAQQWLARVSTTLCDSNAAATALALDDDGNAYICGRVRDSLGFDDCLVARIATTGAVSWVRRYNGPGRGADSASDIAVDSLGEVFVTGASLGDKTGLDVVTMKYSSAGALQWAARYDGTDHADDGGMALVVDPAGDVCVAGYRSGASDQDYVTIKYDSAGAQLWEAGYDGPTHGADIAGALALDRAGGIYVTGSSQSANGQDILCVKYDSSGAVAWTSRYDGPVQGEDSPTSLIVPAPGVAFLTGTSQGGTGSYDCLTAAYLEHDVGVDLILQPGDTVPPQPVVPRVRVHNYGVYNDAVTVHLDVRSDGNLVYKDSVAIAGIIPGVNADVAFQTFPGTEGDYDVSCYTILDGDQNSANDTLSRRLTCRWRVPPAWTQQPNVPGGRSLKQVKDGGALCFGRLGAVGSVVFALKGNNTSEFYGFSPSADTWLSLASMPFAPDRTRCVKKGAALACDPRDSTVYAFKGNSTREFWKYDAARDSWMQLKDIPLGPHNKKVKGGAALAFCHSGGGDLVYALKGGNKSEMWAYHVQGDTWLSRPDVPSGPKRRGMGDGSCLVSVGGMVYALKGKYNEVYAYNASQDSWEPKKSLPVAGVTKGKALARFGSGLCTDGKIIYATKGGKCEFWAYSIEADTWFELEPVPLLPSGRPVRNGGALAYGNGLVWALKGNKTLEFWTYDPGLDLLGWPLLSHDGAMAEESAPADNGRLSIFPNPLVGGIVNLRYSPSEAGPVSVGVYDIAGRCVLEKGIPAGHGGVAALDVRRLSAGVYLLKLGAGTGAAVRKLVVER